MQKTNYQIVDNNDSRKLAQFLCQEGQLLLPVVELISQAEMAIDDLIEVTGRAVRWREGLIHGLEEGVGEAES